MRTIFSSVAAALMLAMAMVSGESFFLFPVVLSVGVAALFIHEDTHKEA